MMREFDWTVAMVSTLLGIKSMVAGALGMVGGGMLADWLTKRGIQDAHLRMYIFIMPIFAVAGITAFTAGNMWVAFGGLAFLGVIAPFIAVAAAALQLATVPERRGIASASFLLVYNLVGFGLGPALVALASTMILGEDGNLGPALALAFMVIPPLIMLLMALGLRPMREAVADVSESEMR
jgi:MFS family permease